MLRLYFLLFLLLLPSSAVFAQSSPYSIDLIDVVLKENAHAVVREQVLSISINSVDKMSMNTRKVITIFNEKGDRFAFAGDFYSNNIKIKEPSKGKIVSNLEFKKIQEDKMKEMRERYNSGGGRGGWGSRSARVN